jgi:hypothetical protein
VKAIDGSLWRSCGMKGEVCADKKYFRGAYLSVEEGLVPRPSLFQSEVSSLPSITRLTNVFLVHTVDVLMESLILHFYLVVAFTVRLSAVSSITGLASARLSIVTLYAPSTAAANRGFSISTFEIAPTVILPVPR